MLPQRERLRSGREFELVYRSGAAYHDGGLSLHVLSRADRSGDRLVGFAVGKKVGKAVVRNLVRRRLREAYRAWSRQVRSGVMLVFTARPAAAQLPYQALHASVGRVLARAGLLASTPPADEAKLFPGESRG